MAKITNPYYEELAYIQSTGTQYIDTGIIANQMASLNYEIDFKLTTTSQALYSAMGCGTWGSGGWYGNIVAFGTNNSGIETCMGTSGNKYLGVRDTNRHKLILDCPNSVAIYDGVSTNITVSTTTGIGSLLLFGSASLNGTTPYNTTSCKCRLYSLKIGTLRDFVPARRKDTGVIGLLDIVNNVFYTNKGTGTFSYGLLADVTVNPVNSGTITGTGNYLLNSNVTLTAVPNNGYSFEKWINKEYILLSAIESTGTQYINPNLNTSKKRKIEVGLAASSTSRYNIYGSGGGSSASDITYSIRFGSSSYPNFAFLSRSDSPGTVITNINVDTNKHDIVLDIANSIGSIDGTNYSLYENTGTSSYAEYIFAYSRLGTVDNTYSFVGKIYYVRYYEDGVLVRNFIPVMRQGDLAVGLLDLVEMKFYGNSGTGQFNAYEESGPTQYPSMTDNPLTITNISNSIILTAQFKRTANCRYKVNGAWKNAMMYIKQNGTWKPGTPKIKINGNWKEGG